MAHPSPINAQCTNFILFDVSQAAAAEFICHEKNIHVYINVKDRRTAKKEQSIVLAAHDNYIIIMTILPIKHNIEHKSIKAQTQKYSIKKNKIGHMKEHKNQFSTIIAFAL